LAAFTILFATLIAAHITRPTLIHGEIMGVAFATLPWGERLAFLDAAASNWETLFLITQLLAILFLFYACIRQYRRGERAAAGALGAGLLLFVATLVIDTLVESGAINFVLASDFGFLPLAIVMSIRLSGNIIRTEEELALYHRRLELLVEERTADLTRANEQLEREVVERTRAEKTLSKRVEELASLSRIAQTLATVTELPVALEEVSRKVAGLFAAQYTYIIVPSDDESRLQIAVGFQRGAGSIGRTPLAVPLGELPYFHQVLSQAESLALTDVQSLPMASPMREFVTSQQIQSAMLVPLVVHGTAVGLMAVATDQVEQSYTPHQVRLAETVAIDLAAAIENARLSEQAQAAAISQERNRIARDLHDSVTQTIYSASLIAEALPLVWERNPDQVRGYLTTILQLIRGSLAEMRTLLFELRPAVLENASLDSMLHQLGDVLTGRAQTPVEVIVQGQTDLPLEVKTALYRIAQEAFNNIAKHAGATKATATLRNLPERVVLVIQDDGRGFDPDSIPAERMGMRIMRERAERIGAELTVKSAVRQGTEVAVEWQREDHRRPTIP
jgi:two-component system nitrate/nitrite sensor histidine kinase NarX